MSLYGSNANTLSLTVCVFVLIHVCVRLAHNHRHAHTLTEVVKMKKYLEAGIIRANSIGLWYFIIHLPTTPAIDGHIFFLHFIFSLINGVELMKMAQSGLVHTGEQHFHCIMCKLAVWASLCWWTFHPRGLCHIYDFSMIKGALLHIGLHHQLLSHTCMLHAVCCMLHAAWSANAGYGVEAWQHYLTPHWTPTQSDDL